MLKIEAVVIHGLQAAESGMCCKVIWVRTSPLPLLKLSIKIQVSRRNEASVCSPVCKLLYLHRPTTLYLCMFRRRMPCSSQVLSTCRPGCA